MPESFSPFAGESLPIFHKFRERDVLFYALGYLARVEKSNWEALLYSSDEWQRLQSHAKRSLDKPESWSQPFSPISLHIYLTRRCNLNCVYCFSNPGETPSKSLTLSTPAILTGAHLVADQCQKRKLPMTCVFHGGGEPTLDNRIEPIAYYVKDLCRQKEISLFMYLATNGVMSPDKFEKIAKLFDLIGLSCDGPPKIQDAQRPRMDGNQSSPFVEHTASIFHDHNQAFEARVTLTKQSWEKMPEIAAYFIEEIHPQAINVELSYQTTDFPVDETEFDSFIKRYFQAQDLCEAAGIPWRTSRMRPGQHHRQYCHILQDTLQIIPGDAATLCFLDNDRFESSCLGTQIGDYDAMKRAWILDDTKINTLRQNILKEADICNQCIVQTHCHRSCPDRCPISSPLNLPDIHCKLNQRLFNALLLRESNKLEEKCLNSHLALAGKEITGC